MINYGIYSRFYVRIAICNNFVKVARDLRKNGIPVGGDGPTAISQEEIDQLVREAKSPPGTFLLQRHRPFGDVEWWPGTTTGSAAVRRRPKAEPRSMTRWWKTRSRPLPVLA